MRLDVLNSVRVAPEQAVHPRAAFRGDGTALARDLARGVDGEVRFDDGSRALYATDSSNYRQVPIGVVVPRTAEAVVEAVGICREHGAPIVSRGGGTSLAGQCCNAAVVIDQSKYRHRVLEIDPKKQVARVEPGCVLDDLRHQAIDEHGLTFAPDPSTHAYCTLGGMIGNNSCGVHSVMAGRTSDCVEELDVLTYDGQRLRVGPTGEQDLDRLAAAEGRRGELYRELRSLRNQHADLIRERYPNIPRRVSGYNLDDLLPERGCNIARALVGSEGTCVVVLEALVRLVPWPKARALVVLGYPDVFHAGDHIPEVMEEGPIGLEGIDETLVRQMRERSMHEEELKLLPPGKGWLIAEFGGDTQAQADHKAHRLRRRLAHRPGAPTMSEFDVLKNEKHIWDVREAGLGATAFVPGKPDSWEGWEDAAVPPERVGAYLRDFKELLDKHGYQTVMYGHFGQGCIHCRINFDFYTREGIRKYRAFIDQAADLVVSYGGSLSGEHGDGQSKAALLPKMYGPEIVEAFRRFKRIWDPTGMMNPGKVVDPYDPTENLRLGTDYNPREVKTHFAYQNEHDRGDFSRATLRCVGVGKCRRHDNAFMCPSFQATREEEHTTRGRAHMLFEMMRSDFITDGWKSRAVLESLDLCLGCKGCKKECPVNVDLATYKSEFLAHHYALRIRPRSHYAMGLIGWWGALGGAMPVLANFFGQVPPFSAGAKWLAGVAPQRRLPRFAPASFRRWFHDRPQPPSVEKSEAVLLYPDLFSEAFTPWSLRAAVLALEALDYRVLIPDNRLPSVRPPIHFGMLRMAKRQLRRLVESLAPHAARGTPIVGLEPSEVAVLRDELPDLLPLSQDARRVARAALLFSEFLDKRCPPIPPLAGVRQAIFHAHCHQKAVLDADAARRTLRRMGLELEEPETGCCGMAGAFGFEREHYNVSIKIGERTLLPSVRRADASTLIISEGFSCRAQIEEGTGRRVRHLSEIVARALGVAPEESGKEPSASSPNGGARGSSSEPLAMTRRSR